MYPRGLLSTLSNFFENWEIKANGDHCGSLQTPLYILFDWKHIQNFNIHIISLFTVIFILTNMSVTSRMQGS